MRILAIGDVYGKYGCDFVLKKLSKIKRENNIDLVIANGENSAHGKGMTKKIYDELMEIIKECQKVAVRAGAESVSAYVKITYRPEGEVLTIEKKVTKHHK